jgi:phasin family protein
MTKEKYAFPFWGNTFNTDAKLPWLDMELLAASYRRNLDLMNTAQQITAETTKSIMQLQTQYMKHVFDQLSEQAKHNLSMTSFEEKSAHQSETTKVTLDQAIEHGREVHSLLSKANEKLIETVQKRFKEGMDESAAMAKKTKEKL